MTRSASGGLELADVIRTHLADYLARYDAITGVEQKRVLGALTACRTAALGGHKNRCDHCGHEEIAYNSCRNRHCPKCQAAARHDWLEARSTELLPVPYYHVVFTLPDLFGPLALQNKRIVYDILFRAASRTLLQIAADPKHLGAQMGFLAV
ncbi:MAG: transposase zinc-binding domain-containing protein, partial [Phycisphaerae bacterium]